MSIRRIGALEEGILRRHTVTWSGRIRDTVYYSILDSEWPGVKADLVPDRSRDDRAGAAGQCRVSRPGRSL